MTPSPHPQPASGERITHHDSPQDATREALPHVGRMVDGGEALSHKRHCTPNLGNTPAELDEGLDYFQHEADKAAQTIRLRELMKDSRASNTGEKA